MIRTAGDPEFGELLRLWIEAGDVIAVQIREPDIAIRLIDGDPVNSVF